MTREIQALCGSMSCHWLDRVAAQATARRKFFARGFGDASVLAHFAAATMYGDPAPIFDVELDPPRWRTRVRRRVSRGDSVVRLGRFVHDSPWLPEALRRGRVWCIEPHDAPDCLPTCIVLCATHDEGPAHRRWLVAPLVKRGVRFVILENPYYGTRRPSGQRRSTLQTVSDQARMTYAMVQEAKGLVAWARRRGAREVGVTGYSMGGFAAALSAATSDFPVAVAVLGAGASPAGAFSGGLLADAVDWRALGEGGDRERVRARLVACFDVGSALHYPPPRRPEAAIIVSAKADGYVPHGEALALHRHWPGSELRVVAGGHTSLALLAPRVLRDAIADALGRLK